MFNFEQVFFQTKSKYLKLFRCINLENFCKTNYKPLSLLPQFSNILDKQYNNRLDMFINKSDILNPSQYGFRSGMSTTEALLDLVEEITTSLENNKYTVGVFIDLKKAFDTVDHDILCKQTAFLWFPWCRTGMDSELFRK